MKAPNAQLILLALLALGAVPLAGCSTDSMPSLPKVGDLNPFKEKIPPLPGKRIAVMPQKEKVPGELADASQPIALPPERVNDQWSQPGGDANNAPGNLVRLDSGALAVVLAVHPPDPYKPRVRIIQLPSRQPLDIPYDVNLWEAPAEGSGPKSVMAPLDPAEYGIDPLGYL